MSNVLDISTKIHLSYRIVKEFSNESFLGYFQQKNDELNK